MSEHDEAAPVADVIETESVSETGEDATKRESGVLDDGFEEPKRQGGRRGGPRRLGRGIRDSNDGQEEVDKQHEITTTTTSDNNIASKNATTAQLVDHGECDKERPSLADQQEAIIALNEKLVGQQEHTIKVLQELSTTIKNLMVAQIRKEKETEIDSKEILEVDRATVRLDGLEVYAVVSALTVATSIACFDAYGADHADIWNGQFDSALFTLIWNTAFLFVSATGIITGLHATLVFSLMTMYGRTAVGVSHDNAFVEFFVQTGRVRYRGFQTFRISLYSFLFQVLFMITAKTSPWLRPISVAVNLYATWKVYVDTQSVIDKASAILFQQVADNKDSAKGLQRTLSDASDGSRETGGRSTSPIPRRGVRGGPRGGPRAGTQSTGEAGSTNPTPRVKKGVVRTKSGFAVYDVGPQQVRRGGRRHKVT